MSGATPKSVSYSVFALARSLKGLMIALRLAATKSSLHPPRHIDRLSVVNALTETDGGV